MARGLDRKHCSEECRRPARVINCEECGDNFRVVPSDKNRRFCSFACYRRSNSETRLEARIGAALQDLGVRFVREHRVGRYSVDFAVVGIKLAIEADGDYWHDAEKDARRDKVLASMGWATVRFGETEVYEADDIHSLVISRLPIEALP